MAKNKEAAKKPEPELWGLRQAARELRMSIGLVKKLVEVGELPTLATPVLGTLVREGTVPAPADTPPDRWGVRPKTVPATAIVEDMKYFDAAAVRAFGRTFQARWNAPCGACSIDDLGRRTAKPKRDCRECRGTGEGRYRRELAPKLAAFGRPEREL